MSKPVVICVDDEPTVLDSLKIELRRVLGDQCLIETAEGAAEALELLAELQQEHYEVAVVVADYIMPGVRGDELLKQVHVRSPATLTIMLSGQADVEAVGSAIHHAKLYRYLSKPWQAADLSMTVLEAVRSYVKTRRLNAQGQRLRQLNQQLARSVQELHQAEAVLQQQAQQERVLNQVVQAIRQSLELSTVFSTAVNEVGRALQTDRTAILQFCADQQDWLMVADYCCQAHAPSRVGTRIPDQDNPVMARLKQFEVVQLEDPHLESAPLIRHLAQDYPGRWLVVPLEIQAQDRQIWGGLGLSRAEDQAPWQDWEIELVQAIADSLAIAIQQSQLYTQVQALNTTLEQQVQDRTAQLAASLQSIQDLSQVKDDFLHAVSHDLRVPITGMVLVLKNFLGKATDSVTFSRSVLEQMVESGERQLQMLDSLLEAHFSDLNGIPLQRESLNLGELMAAVGQDLAPLISQNQATLLTQVPLDLPTIQADPLQVRRVFENLISNALKHNLPGVELVLGAAAMGKLGGPVPWVHCWLRDNGTGMDPAEGEQLFDRYRRGTRGRRSQGIGLGLYLCRQIITAHGGDIGVTTALGQGSTFWFTLPVKSPADGDDGQNGASIEHQVFRQINSQADSPIDF
jgi:signal transduction histidine kinase/FixJ family two-component response regulator